MIGKNNPLNVRYNPLNRWIGQSGQTSGFCNFSDILYCIRAVAYLIMISYRKQGLYSVSEVISRYAPADENNTSTYIKFVCLKTNFSPTSHIITVRQVAELIFFMSRFEGNDLFSYGYDIYGIINCIKSFNLKFYEKS